jgi:hypothetical protein
MDAGPKTDPNDHTVMAKAPCGCLFASPDRRFAVYFTPCKTAGHVGICGTENGCVYDSPGAMYSLHVVPYKSYHRESVGEWEPGRDAKDYPGKCPRCKGPAYIGFSEVDCKAGCR